MFFNGISIYFITGKSAPFDKNQYAFFLTHQLCHKSALKSIDLSEILNNALITGCMIYPSPTYGTCPAHCYNTVLYMHAISDSIDLNLCFDNETLFSQCEKVLSEEPIFTDINFRNYFAFSMGNINVI